MQWNFGNFVRDSVCTDNPLLNGKPRAVVIVTHDVNPGDEASIAYTGLPPLAVYYDSSSQRWCVFNTNAALMGSGEAFNVLDAGTA